MAGGAKPPLSRYAPLLLGLLALAVFGAGIWLQFQANMRAEARIAAYLDGPPAAVPLQRFDAGAHSTGFGEALIGAQLDLTRALPLDPAVEGGPTALAVPMHATDATAASRPAGIAIFTGPRYLPGRITADGLAALADRVGEVGPDLVLNGVAAEAGDWAAGLAAGGFDPATVVLYPFVEGRRTALVAQDAPAIFGQFAKLGGALAMLALVLIAFDTRRDDLVVGAGGQNRLEDALRVPQRQGRPAVRVLALVTILGALGSAAWLWRDRVDLTKLREFFVTRDFGTLREAVQWPGSGPGPEAPAASAGDIVAAASETALRLRDAAQVRTEAVLAGVSAGDPAALGTAAAVALAGLAVLWLLLRSMLRVRGGRARTA